MEGQHCQLLRLEKQQVRPVHGPVDALLVVSDLRHILADAVSQITGTDNVLAWSGSSRGCTTWGPVATVQHASMQIHCCADHFGAGKQPAPIVVDTLKPPPA